MSHPQDTSTHRFGATMMTLAWVLALALLTALFSGLWENQQNPNQRVASSIDTQGIREVVLKQNRSGHYVAPGMINGHPVRFLVDTGATTIAVPEGLARRLDLRRGSTRYVQTANGLAKTYATDLAQVELGNIVMHQVPALINPYMHGNDVLLGMSFLKRVEFSQRGETLTLRQYPVS